MACMYVCMYVWMFTGRHSVTMQWDSINCVNVFENNNTLLLYGQSSEGWRIILFIFLCSTFFMGVVSYIHSSLQMLNPICTRTARYYIANHREYCKARVPFRWLSFLFLWGRTYAGIYYILTRYIKTWMMLFVTHAQRRIFFVIMEIFQAGRQTDRLRLA